MVDKLPSSPDSEKALLGSMMLSPDRVIGDFAERGSAEYFFNPINRTLYAQMLSLWQSKHTIDQVVLTEYLEVSGLLEEIGGAGYVTELFTFVPSGSNARHYTDILREKWAARGAIEIAKEIQDAAYDPMHEKDIQNIVQEGLVKLSSMFESRAKTHAMPDLVMRALDRYEHSQQSGGAVMGILTGIPPLDRATRGLHPGQMVTIAAPTKQGKSALALNIAVHNGLKGIPVGVFSMEMGADELIDRMISSHGRVDFASMTEGGFSGPEIDRLVKAGADLTKANIHIRDEACMSSIQFRAAARKIHAQHKCQLLIVDYLQLMTPMNEKENRERQVAECSRTMKQTAAELQIPIIVLAQLNRLGQARESATIESDSNLFMIIEEDEEHNFYINIKLSRSCPRAKVPVNFLKQYVTFTA